MQFALNHMVAPALSLEALFELAVSLDINAVEIRNDLDGNAIADGTPPDRIRPLAERHGLAILSINALQRFNDWTPDRAYEADSLIAYAAASGARALVLVPRNDGGGLEDGRRQESLIEALRQLKPRLQAHGLTGLVEPLGFTTCSLRSKREAVDAIAQAEGGGVFKLVHDTFHHHLAGEPEIFADATGLAHISGVDNGTLATDALRDADRVLVGPGDRLDNLGQIAALRRAGYRGALSFEPFASEVHGLADPRAAIRESMDLIRHGG